MAYELKGKLEEIGDTTSVTEKFQKREFVVRVSDGMYDQYIKLQLTQDKCDLIDGFSEGDQVHVWFNLRGRPFEKEGKKIYFTNLDAWRVQKEDEAIGNQENESIPSDTMTESSFAASDDDELPF